MAQPTLDELEARVRALETDDVFAAAPATNGDGSSAELQREVRELKAERDRLKEAAAAAAAREQELAVALGKAKYQIKHLRRAIADLERPTTQED